MRSAFLGLFVALVTVGPAGAAVDPAVVGVPGKMLAALMADDAGALRAECAANAVVVDEFAPYVWSGPDACVRWAAGFTAMGKQIKMSGFKGTFEPNPFVDSNGGRVYLASRLHFAGLLDKKPFAEAGTWTFVFVKEAGAWKVTSLSWGTLHH